jgi:hypothetical protein
MQRIPNTASVTSLLLAAILIPFTSWAAQTIVSGKQMREDTAGYQEFSDRVQRYMQLHNSVAAELQRLKRADSPENINAHQQELARNIREVRGHAHPGSIFIPEASKAIRHAIRSVLGSVKADPARATIEQGPRPKISHVEVNQLFPETVPYTTVPPTLLLKLPRLPDELAYRIVERDLVLIDVPAGLVVDVMPKAIP